jgi:hypothetical protein
LEPRELLPAPKMNDQLRLRTVIRRRVSMEAMLGRYG